nr:vicilin-like seed storage protein At2g18540 [Lolium perenne]
MVDSWEEETLEAAVEVVEEDPQFAEYEAWKEAALVATVDAFVVDERQELKEARRRREEVRRQRERRWEVRQQKEWEHLALRRVMREEEQRQDEGYERRRLAEMQLRIQRQKLDHRRRREDLERQLHQEAVATDRSAYLTFVAERAVDHRWRSSGQSMGESCGRSSTSTEPVGQ